MKNKNRNLILLVDDDELIHFYNTRIFLLSGFNDEIVSVESGLESIEKLKHLDLQRYGKILLLLDLNMPGMDGWSFLEQFKLLERDIRTKCRICILTTSDDPMDIEKSNEFSIVDMFMSKPLTKNQAASLVNKYF